MSNTGLARPPETCQGLESILTVFDRQARSGYGPIYRDWVETGHYLNAILERKTVKLQREHGRT